MKNKFTLLITLAFLLLFGYSSKAQYCIIEVTQPDKLTAQIDGTSQTVCSGAEVSFNINFNGGTKPWKLYIGGTLIADNINSSPYLYTTTLTSTTTFSSNPTGGSNVNVTIKDANDCTAAASDVTGSVTFTVVDVVAISTQPASTTICSGSDATLSVAATGGGGSYNYQWQKQTSTTPLPDGTWADIDGANSASYTATGLTETTTYRVKVSSATATGCNEVISTPATVTVLGNISITAQPASTTVCSGVQATLSVTASGSVGHTLNYQWQKYDGSDWQNVGTNSNEYTTTAETPAAGTMATTTYRVIVTYVEIPTCGSATSSNAIVTTSGGPTSQYTLTNATCYGGTGSIVIKVTAGQPNFTVTLYEGEGLGGTSTSKTVTTVNGTATFEPLPAMKYTVTVKDQYGCEGSCPTAP